MRLSVDGLKMCSNAYASRSPRCGSGLASRTRYFAAWGRDCLASARRRRSRECRGCATITNDCQRDSAADLASAIVRMHRDDAANTSCAQTGLMYVDAFYNQSRIDALIHEMAQPALDRYAWSRYRSECIVLNFGKTHRQPSGMIATRAQPTAKRVAFT